MKLGLLYTILTPEVTMLIGAAEKRGVQVAKVLDAGLVSSLDAPASANSNPFSAEVSAVLQRSSSFSRSLYSTKVLEEAGLRVINSHSVQSLCGDKALTTLAFARAKIPTPKTKIAYTKDGAMEAIAELGYPAVLKPVVGSWGRLLAKVNDGEAAQAVLEHKDELGSYMHKVYYIQEYIEKNGRDIRAIVVGDEVVTAYYRNSADGGWITNIAHGGKGTTLKMTSELSEICLKAAKCVGGGILGIDVFESKRGLLVNEVNHGVEFKGAFAATGIDIAGKMVEHAVKVAKK
jgi:[lysine-biosynthesis-protein LysW]--L-2-aminoadipate ligase